MQNVSRVIAKAVGLWAVAGAGVGSASGAPFTWTGVNLAKAFNEPANWSPGGPPGAADNPQFRISDTVIFTSNQTNDSAFVGTGASAISVFMSASGGSRTWSLNALDVTQLGHLTLNGPDVNVQFATHVERDGTLVINAGSKLTSGSVSTDPIPFLTFGATGTITVNGGALETRNQLEIAGGVFQKKSGHGVLTFNGGLGTFAGAVDLAESGDDVTARMTLTNNALVTQTIGTATIAGRLRLATSETFTNGAATLSISSGAKYRALGFATEVGSTSQGRGTISVGTGGWFEGNAALNINPRGTVIVNGGTLSGMSMVNVKGGSLVLGIGTISSSINVESGGTFAAASTFALATQLRVGTGLGTLASGLGTFANGLNAGIDASGIIVTEHAGVINAANGTSVWGSGTSGSAVGSLSGTHTVGTLLVGANAGAATITIQNGGRLDVNGALTVGDNLGTNPARIVVNGPVGTLSMGNFVPTVINRRGSIELLGGGRFFGSDLTVDGGTFNGTAGTYSIAAISPFQARLLVTNNGLFQGNDLNMGLSDMGVGSGGQLLLTGALTLDRAQLGVGGTNSLVQANTAQIFRSNVLVFEQGLLSFGTLSQPFNPLGVSTLTVTFDGRLRVSNAMSVGVGNAFTIFSGSGSISGSLTNAGRLRMSGGSLTVAGPTDNSGTIEIDTGGGTNGITASFGDVDGSGRFMSDGIATVTFNRLRQSSLILQGETYLRTRPNGGAPGVSRLGTLDFGSAESDTHWDLSDNDLILDSSPASYIRALLKIGRNGGGWDGGGISSSAAAANPRTALGYGANTALGYSTFSGQSVSASVTLVKYTYEGDADLDGDADGVDIGKWATNFTGELSSGPTATRVWTQGDWDYDGDVDGVDAGMWATAFTGELSGGGLTIEVTSPLNVQAQAILAALGITVVPEPATASLLGLCAAAGLARRSPRRSRTLA